MFDSEDRRQNELDYEFVVDLRNALIKAIQEADRWYDECRSNRPAPGLEKERNLLKSVRLDDIDL